jgi:hypothetical protein
MIRPQYFLTTRARFLLIAVLTAPLAAACDNGPAVLGPDTSTPVATSPVTETFSTQLAVGGYASRSFNAAKAGTATVTLTSAGSSSTVKLGLGVGIPDINGNGCLFTRSTDTAAGGQLSIAVDAGVYCVKLYDIGTLTSNINFTITIVRP